MSGVTRHPRPHPRPAPSPRHDTALGDWLVMLWLAVTLTAVLSAYLGVWS